MQHNLSTFIKLCQGLILVDTFNVILCMCIRWVLREIYNNRMAIKRFAASGKKNIESPTDLADVPAALLPSNKSRNVKQNNVY